MSVGKERFVPHFQGTEVRQHGAMDLKTLNQNAQYCTEASSLLSVLTQSAAPKTKNPKGKQSAHYEKEFRVVFCRLLNEE